MQSHKIGINRVGDQVTCDPVVQTNVKAGDILEFSSPDGELNWAVCFGNDAPFEGEPNTAPSEKTRKYAYSQGPRQLWCNPQRQGYDYRKHKYLAIAWDKNGIALKPADPEVDVEENGE